jgi:Amt family ammonium transporter
MMRFATKKRPLILFIIAICLIAAANGAVGLAEDFAAPLAQESAAAAGGSDVPTAAEVQKNLDFVWTMVAAFLVFFMQAGFAMVESGFTRAKNAVNIMMKNLMDFSVGSIAFLLLGFGLMFGTSPTGWFGTDGFLLSDFAKDADKWLYAFWMFQVVFAATAATIVSGAMAERTKFSAYLIYSAVITALIYPVFGSWAWGSLHHGNGWLEKLGFIDFAGSTVVHSVGGWAALWGAVMLGPRMGRYEKDGKVMAIPGHNIPMAALGVFILWFGWFGFNPGSTTAGNADIARIAVNTNLAAAAGAIASLIASWGIFRKPDGAMALNGVLAGLVAITSPCATVTPMASVYIGAIAGVVVVLSVLFFDRIRIDDPVGAISVHGVCGALGTLLAAVFHEEGFTMARLGVQALGVGFLFFLIKKTVGLRVSEEEEMDGLDYHEHGNTAYPNFQLIEKR